MPDATGEAPLTENEREIALVVAEREGGETRKWLNLVLGAYDGLQARLTACENEREALGHGRTGWPEVDAWKRKTQQAEARFATAEEALRGIAEFEPHPEVVIDQFAYDRVVDALRDAARAALAGFAATQETKP